MPALAPDYSDGELETTSIFADVVKSPRIIAASAAVSHPTLGELTDCIVRAAPIGQ